MIINIDNIINNAYDVVMKHQISEGEFCRWLWQDQNGTRELGINEYGCADAANILYSIGKFPATSQSREKWIEALQKLQNKDTGLFVEKTHHPIHTTAHCIAALELFDAKPLYPLTSLMQYATNEGITEFLDGLDWKNDPWDQSHRGAGIYAALKLSDSVDNEWCDTYFDWLWENADPETGFWRKGEVLSGCAPRVAHMAGTFHYLFNQEYAKRPLRYPDKVIDTCLDMWYKKQLTITFGEFIGFAEIDWVYCITRASRQTPHRFEESRKALMDFAVSFIGFLNSLDAKTHDGFNDLHALFGTVCCLAELQTALPGMIRTSKPLKLVLDRRPFI